MSRIWAKSNKITLRQHVQEILEAFKIVEDRVKNEDIKKAIKLAIILHDLGKALPYFQIMVLKNRDYKPVEINEYTNIYHSLASILFINEDKLKSILNHDHELFNYILSAVAFHHWKDSLEKDLLDTTEKAQALKRSNILKEVVGNIKREFKNMVIDSININDLIDINEAVFYGLLNGASFINYLIPLYRMDYLPKQLELDEEGKRKLILISGFLQRCDHYVSFIEGQENWLEKSDKERYREIEKVEIKCKYSDISDKIKEYIKKKTRGEVRLWQEDILKHLQNENVILEAPTGSGKTEFAFLWKKDSKLIYTLPLRVASEQIFSRAQDIFGENCVSILHGDADVFLLKELINRRKENLKEKIELEVDPEIHQETLRIYSLSRELSYPVIISTGDQFFPYALRPPGYPRIYATLSYSGLVIDEVQAYDPKASAIIVKFIEDTVRMGGKFLLMTATLPEHIKKEIENRIGNNYEHINIYEKFKDKYKGIKKHKISLIKFEDFDNYEEIVSKIIYVAKKGKRVLVILNSVKKAKEIYERLKEKAEGIKYIRLFHSRMTINEKKRIKEEIEREFKNPKDKNEKEGKILVATQVVEASIDIDADVLFTEICPIDALVQRMGRVLRRYKENYEYAEEEPNVIVFYVEEKKNNKEKKILQSGGEVVYQNILINTSYEIIKEKEDKVISEYEKYQMIKELYRKIEDNDYLREFYETLDILDAGYMSDKKEDAQKIFRNIIDISCVEEDKEPEFKEDLKEFIKSSDLSFTLFKAKIVAKYVIPIPYYQIQRGEVKVSKTAKEWLNELEEELKEELKEKKYKNRIQKLKKWCSDIFVIASDKEEGHII